MTLTLLNTAHSQVSNVTVQYRPVNERLAIAWKGNLRQRYKVVLSAEGGAVISEISRTSTQVSLSSSALTEGQRYTVTIATVSAPRRRARKTISFTRKVRTPEALKTFHATNPAGRKGVYYLPKNYRLKTLPAMLLFHGSSIDGRRIASIFKKIAKERNFILIAPDSYDVAGWELEINGGEATEDQKHIANCLQEVMQLPHMAIDPTKFLAAGVSAGGAVAAFYGSTDARFSAMANLHGGVLLSALGNNLIPTWLSTGTVDPFRTAEDMLRYEAGLTAKGFTDVTFREYEVGHDVRNEEKKELVDWWLLNQRFQ